MLDPLVETHANFDENNNVDMKEVLIALRKLARHCNIPVLIVHHSRKGSNGGDQDGARGGSSLVNACRVVLTLDRMDEKTHESIKPPQPKEYYVRITGAKANYAGRIGDRWLELEPIVLPNGDAVPGLKKVAFGGLEQGFDVDTWEYREPFLKLVQEGRDNGRLWSTAITGKKAARLDAKVADLFKMDAGMAKEVLHRFEQAGLIERAQQLDEHRKPIHVWIVVGQALPPETLEIPF